MRWLDNVLMSFDGLHRRQMPVAHQFLRIRSLHVVPLRVGSLTKHGSFTKAANPQRHEQGVCAEILLRRLLVHEGS
jgi:hypothetical protein